MAQFIALEGPDAAGKTTLAQLLSDALTQIGVAHTLTREPGGTPLGKHIRELLLTPQHAPTPTTELLMYAADRAQHVETLIKPALAQGHTVITDRYTASTIAYQHFACGLPIGAIVELNRLATGGLQPDHTILLDITPQEALRRMRDRKQDRLETETLNRMHHIREGYLTQAENDPTWLVLDATQDPHTLAMLALDRITQHEREQAMQQVA